MCTVCHGVSRWPTRMQSERPTIYTVQYMCMYSHQFREEIRQLSLIKLSVNNGVLCRKTKERIPNPEFRKNGLNMKKMLK